MRFINYYGNYKVYHKQPEKVNWPALKMVIHRNLPNVEVWGDGSNVRLLQSERNVNSDDTRITCHHFGFVRNPARLREKWRNLQGNLHTVKRRKWFKLPSFLFNWWPHNWLDPQFLDGLSLYEGPYIKAVQENPNEFIRDRLQIYNHLKKLSQEEREVLVRRSSQHSARPT